MSSKVWNAAIAVVEDRPEVAREILREQPVELYIRLCQAVKTSNDKAIASKLREVLGACLRLQPPSGVDAGAFYEGVQAAESQIERRIMESVELLEEEHA